MRNYVSIGPSPVSEDCVQLDSNDPTYLRRMRKECEIFLRQLRRVFGEPPEGAGLSIKSNPHDFGTYLEVVCWFDTGVEASVEYAFNMEKNTPEYWDDEAKEELKTKGRFFWFDAPFS